MNNRGALELGSPIRDFMVGGKGSHCFHQSLLEMDTTMTMFLNMSDWLLSHRWSGQR